jgi:diketogulonate reductase-like aldo/keto reductase
MKWLVDKGIAVVTKADSAEYLAQDIDMYSWNISSTDTQSLSANRKYPDVPSWACTA